MPGWFDAEYKDCANCRKRFEVFRSSLWAYKQNSLFFCTWHCLREYEQKKGKTDMAKKLTLEQKKKAVQIAIDGGNPLDYLKECGSDAPEKIWWFIKNKLKETHPDLYSQIPDRRTKKTTVKAEKKAVEKKPEKPVPQDGVEWIPAEKTEPVKEAEKEIITPVKEEIPFLPVKSEVKINLNDEVKVKLTVLGIKTYIDYMNEPNAGRTDNPVIKPKSCLPCIDEEGYTTMLLWQLMSIFGQHIYMAADPVFMPLEIIKVG